MKPKNLPKIYAIIDSYTQTYVSFGSKCAWVSAGAAKNAYNCHMSSSTGKTFDEQTKYTIVEIY